MLKFYKYHGAGNDFVLIDNFNEKLFEFSVEHIIKICNRRFGVGADGFMILKKHSEYDFEMDYYNSDGSGGTMCGNGGRCIVAFAKKLGIIDNYAKFIASDGLHEAYINKNIVRLRMSDVNSINKIGEDYNCYTGSPHYIKFEKDVDNKDVFTEGRRIRNSELYKKEGINVNFVKIYNDNTLIIRTYERGVEAETFACGTGAVASALSFAEINNKISGEYIIKAKGGELKVSFEKNNQIYKNIWLTGLAELVFEGVFYNLNSK